MQAENQGIILIITNEYINPKKLSDKWCLCHCCNNVESFDDNNDYDSVSIYSEQTNRSTGSIASQNNNMSQISNPNKISYYLAHTFTYKKQGQFEKHILNMTIENGWSFRWVKCKSVIAHYHWLNSNLILPNCKQLAGQILKTKAKEDSNGLILAFDE
ncbi:28798_t:CDS:2 [Gigaspora margarita]|uniref:28798_t:CDS:1 n=1 Tax=Gigaspora margarita TaxID=4874 RepID=A0ABN7UUF0_GIGMA|nr:28798_t:CDS:2 [Gigaspora margarita]